jgi:hypothetical protein
LPRNGTPAQLAVQAFSAKRRASFAVCEVVVKPVSPLLSIIAAAALASSALDASAADVPQRKPGLWEITTVAAGTGMTTIKACVGANDSIATPSESGECSEPKATRAGEDVIVDVVCKKPFGKEIISTAFSGDFTKRYHAVMKISFDPPEGVKTMGVTLDARYLGPDCKPETGGE